MKYQSKKNTEVTARLESMDDKYNTVLMVYETGPNVGKSFSITTSTLKRWWSQIKDETPNSILNIDNSVVNTKYPEPKVQKYVPKPKSVVEYEAKKNKKFNANLPEFEQLVSDFEKFCAKVNDNSKYVKFHDNSTMWRKVSFIAIYASEDLWGKLTEKGLQSSPNKDKDRPFAFKINNKEEYDMVLEVFNV